MSADSDRLRACFAAARASDAQSAPGADAMLAHARRHPARAARPRVRKISVIALITATAAAVVLVAIRLTQSAPQPATPATATDLAPIEARCRSLQRAIAEDPAPSLFDWRPASRAWSL